MFPSETGKVRRQSVASARTFGFGYAALLAVASSIAASGCSLVIDTDKPQCKTTADCTAAFGTTAPYVCQSNFCVRPTCETTSDCRAMGDQFLTAICDANKLCSTAECVSNEQCVIGQVCDPNSNVCIPKQCDTTEECKSKSAYNTPLVSCQAGICVDKKWGCIGKPDDRSAATMPTATMRIRLLDFQTMNPHMGVDARVCNTPTFGDPCTQTIPGTGSTYDQGTGVVSITGIPLSYGWRYWLQASMNPNSSDPKDQPIGIDFYTQKTPQDIFEVPGQLTTVTRRILDVLSAAFADRVTIPEDSAGATIFFYDCQNQSADGVVMDKINDTSLITYFGQTGTPDPQATETSSSGMLSVINMPGEITVTLRPSVKVGATLYPLPTFQVMALKSRLTTIHMYPRNYLK